MAAGVGAAVFMGWGCAVASADDSGQADSSEQRDAGPVREKHAVDRGDGGSDARDDDAAESEGAQDVTDDEVTADEGVSEAEVTEDAEQEKRSDATVVDLDDDAPEPAVQQPEEPEPEPEPAPAVVAHVVTATAAPRRELGTETATTAAHVTQNAVVYTDEPSFVDQVIVASLYVMRGISSFIGVDIYGLIGKVLENDDPPWFVRGGLDVRRTEFEASEDSTWDVWEFRPPNPTGKTVIAVHGGGFIVEPLVTHWLSYANMARETGATVIVPMYPLAKTDAGTAVTVVPAMADFLSDQIAAYGAENVSIYSDSAGPTLAMAAVRELVLDGKPVPASMVLLSFAPDLSLSNPDIYDIDDPIIDVRNLDFYTRENHWGDGLDPKDPLLSPLFFEDEVLAALPPTTIYVGELEYLLPDTLLLHDKWSGAGGIVSTVIGTGQFHDWALGGLSFNSAGPKVRQDIYRQLALNDVAPGPKTITTDPPTYSDRLVADILRTLRWLNEETGIKLLSGFASGATYDSPPRLLTLGLDVTEREYNGWTVWELASPEPTGEVVVALHGGGFATEANVLQWSDYAQMVRDTGATVLVPIYPLAPPKGTGTVTTLVPPMADYLSMLIDEHGVDNVSLYGDSSGGSYAVLVVQEMLRRCRSDVQCVISEAQPSRMVLVSPALHITLSGPEIDAIDDPVLPRNKPGEGPRYNGDLDLNDPLVNPFSSADLTGLPPTAIYIGTQEKLYPGALAFRDKLLSQDPAADLTVIIGDGQLHGWALGGIVVNSQAQLWRPNVYRQLGLLPTDRHVTLQVA
ncbi:alpha/beta hydrolase fold domain-containing protein [Mycolicibacterium sp. BiH015]|uniref:alpha/beta hydrolase fold domain-containing protein n=1 Tax=Mycolicibacterium sp. BiH015 TaxID=3018808 RepID=UPI0022E29811|nr:alpha/beta hydrolase fold domain-containing protein [Mycolicibacterium sp. BiH015]MDA2894441.1 alpha/beta hydrolase fold domain-containing protein [Mycolicibacterium sp. BiH015]